MKLSKYPCWAKKHFGSIDNSELKYTVCHAVTLFLNAHCKDREQVDKNYAVVCRECVSFGHYLIELIMERWE